MTIITTNDDRRYQTAGIGKTMTAVAVGGGVCTATILAQVPFEKYSKNQIAKIGQSCDSVVLNQGIDKAFENFKLPSKAVKIINVNENTPSNPIFEKLPNWLRKQLDFLEEAKAGKNTFFQATDNQIIVNRNKLGTGAFHEMGHAVNYNFSKFWKGMQGLRLPCMASGVLFGTVALFKRKKVEGEEPNGFIDKTTTFIINIVWKLLFITSAPIVAEELMATHRGNKMAKKVLSPELFNKVKLTNRWGLAIYITSAVGTALAAVAGSKIRDAIAKPKEITD